MGLPRTCPACSGTLRWIQMESGRMVPVDPVPTPKTGTVAARRAGDNRYAAGYTITPRNPLRDGFTLFDPHRLVCDMKRRPRTGPKAQPAPLF